MGASGGPRGGAGWPGVVDLGVYGREWAESVACDGIIAVHGHFTVRIRRNLLQIAAVGVESEKVFGLNSITYRSGTRLA